MYGIKEITPGTQRLEAWIRRGGKLLLYDTEKAAQKQVDIWNVKYPGRYFVKEWRN